MIAFWIDNIYAGWVLGNMVPFFYLLKLLHFLRVPPEEETMGLDASYHGGHAYPGHNEDEKAEKLNPMNHSVRTKIRSAACD